MDGNGVNYCDICGCSLTETNLNIDHVKYLNWNGETVYLCNSCLNCLKNIAELI
jgi:hypothetical protein